MVLSQTAQRYNMIWAKSRKLVEPKQSSRIGFNLAQIARLPQIGIGNLAFECFARLGPIGHKKPKGRLARLVIPRLEVILSQKPD